MNAYPFFQDQLMDNPYSTFAAESYNTPPFAGSNMGSMWDPLDPGSNPGMDDAGKPSTMAMTDGEAVKRTMLLAKFPDGSHNNMLCQGAFAFVCGNRSDASNVSTHVLGPIGWVNSFSDKQSEMGLQNLSGIVNLVSENLDIRPDIANGGGGGGGGNLSSGGGSDILSLIVADREMEDSGGRRYMGNVVFNRKSANGDTVSSKTYGNSPFESKKLSLAIIESTESTGKPAFFKGKALILWLDFVKKVGNQYQLLEMLSLDAKGLENKLLYGSRPATKGYSEAHDVDVDNNVQRPPVLNDWFTKGSLYVVKAKLAFDVQTPRQSTRFVAEPKDNKMFFGTDKHDDYLAMLGLAGNANSKDIMQKVTDLAKSLHRCNLKILDIYSNSFNMPKESAFNSSATTAMPYLLAGQHMKLFKPYGVVEAIDDNSESRSIRGQAFSSGPKAEIVTRRRVQAKNIWGSKLAGGQTLYFIHTRNFAKELESGNWYPNLIVQENPGFSGMNRTYYDPNAKRTYDRRRDDFVEEADMAKKHQERQERLLAASSSAKKKSEVRYCDRTVQVKDTIRVRNITTKPISRENRQKGGVEFRYSKQAWDGMDPMSKIEAAWNQYGGCCWIPATNVTAEYLNEYYGYPDIFGTWNPPEIFVVGTSVFTYEFPHYSEQNLFRTVSGSMIASSSGNTRRYEKMSNYDILSAYGKMPTIEVSLGS